MDTFQGFFIHQYGRSFFRYRFPNRPFELSKMNARKHWSLGALSQGMTKTDNINSSDALNVAFEKMNPSEIFKAVDSQLQLLHPDVRLEKLAGNHIAINTPLPLDGAFCPLRLIFRSLIDLTSISGFIHQEHIGGITLLKHDDDTYLYAWTLNNPNLGFEIIEELRLAMLIIVTGYFSSAFPLAIRNRETKDTRFCNPELSREMCDYTASVERIVFFAVNSDVIAKTARGVGRNYFDLDRDIEMLLKSLL
jgi:hypothetical protein